MRPVFATLLAALMLPFPQPGQGTARSFPAPVERYLTSVNATAEDRRQLLAGGSIARALPADASKELAVFGAAWVNAPIARYVQRLTDIEQFERGGRFKLTRRISSPPSLSDFAALRLTDE